MTYVEVKYSVNVMKYNTITLTHTENKLNWTT